MKLNFRFMASVVITAMAISACENDALPIGQTLTKENDKLDVASASFEVATRTILADSVFTLSTNCYFGKVKDPETGAEVKSEFTTQFHLLESTYISPSDKIVGRDNDRPAADSCQLMLYLSSPFNTSDSLQALKMHIQELLRPMEEGMRYYSNYSPVTMGMINHNGLSKNKMFTYKNMGDTDSIRAITSYQDNIRITLNEPYTKDGITYSNYGTFILNQYYDHPEFFRNSYAFSHNVCPGFFFEITDGLGFHSKITDVGLRTHYRVAGDSITKAVLTLAGTQEVLQTTLVTNDKETLQRLANETEHTYLKSPAGLFTEVTLPVEAIKKGHENDSLLAAKITFQRLNNQSSDKRMFGIPSLLLMVQKDSLSNFFEKTKTADEKTSYTASYDVSSSTSSTKAYKNIYTFDNISELITTLWNMKRDGERTNANWTAEHPNWNKVVLVPVTNGTSGIEHDMSLTSTRLVGGPNNPNSPVVVNVVYAKFKSN